jgi:ATP-dependent DNA helicase RecQ
VLIRRDAEQVAAWLNQQEITARAYHGSIEHHDFKDSSQYRQSLEDLLLRNEIKVLVATTALGMGYDKPDLGFVIHYQAASSIIGYYQQVSWAGRAIDNAYGVCYQAVRKMISTKYFRRSAFPDKQDVNAILQALEKSDGLSVIQLQKYLNLRQGQIEKVLKILSVENPAPVIKQGSKWRRTPVLFRMDHERIEHLIQQRKIEWQEMQGYIDSDECLMAYLRDALDDPETTECGRCSVCRGEPVVSTQVDRHLAIAAGQFLRRQAVKKLLVYLLILHAKQKRESEHFRTRENEIIELRISLSFSLILFIILNR